MKTAPFVSNLLAIKREKQLWRQNIAMQQRMKISSERRKGMGGSKKEEEGEGLIRWSQEPPLLPVDCCNMWGFY